MASKKTTAGTGKSQHDTSTPGRLYRSETNRVLGGVAGGIAEYFAIDPTFIRLLFILITIFGGAGVVLYIALWIVIPTKSATLVNSDAYIKENLHEIHAKAQSFAADIKPLAQRKDNRSLWGYVLLFLGFMFLLKTLNIFDVDFGKFWPVWLIIAGLLILLRR